MERCTVRVQASTRAAAESDEAPESDQRIGKKDRRRDKLGVTSHRRRWDKQDGHQRPRLASQGGCWRNVRARAFRGRDVLPTEHRLSGQRVPKQIRIRSTTSIWPYSARLDSAQDGGGPQIRVVVRADTNN